MFTQPCFIRKNTPELRNKLKDIGYKYRGKTIIAELSCLYCNHGLFFECNQIPSRYDRIINCGTNEDLFLAIAALRNDTDKNQWFTDYPGHWYKCTSDNGNLFIRLHYNLSDFNAHKATVKELINHFKKE